MAKQDGGPAFPGKQSPDAATVKDLREATGLGMHECSKLLSEHGGMSLRDWFAGQALAGLLAGRGEYVWNAEPVDAYAIADAMLAERSRGDAR